MSAAVICDQCETMLKVDKRGDDEYGERSAWIGLTVAGFDYETCTTTCAIQFLQREDVAEMLADRLGTISEIARTIRGDEDE